MRFIPGRSERDVAADRLHLKAADGIKKPLCRDYWPEPFDYGSARLKVALHCGIADDDDSLGGTEGLEGLQVSDYRGARLFCEKAQLLHGRKMEAAVKVERVAAKQPHPLRIQPALSRSPRNQQAALFIAFHFEFLLSNPLPSLHAAHQPLKRDNPHSIDQCMQILDSAPAHSAIYRLMRLHTAASDYQMSAVWRVLPA
jgi:hypothetical protein